jgi:hypothetical protein
VRQARAVMQRMGDEREPQKQAPVMGSPPREINLISCGPLGHVSDIKLIRTDTTLDLSQKAEKGMLCITACFCFCTGPPFPCSFISSVWYHLRITDSQIRSFISSVWYHLRITDSQIQPSWHRASKHLKPYFIQDASK